MKIVMSLASLRAHAANAVGVIAHVHVSHAAAVNSKPVCGLTATHFFIFENQA